LVTPGPDQQAQPPREAPENSDSAPDRLVGLRVVAAILSTIVLVLVAVNTSSTVGDAADAGASAVQIVQLYAEGLFWFVFTIGLTISAYVFTRTTR
jgi:hypothetical protein